MDRPANDVVAASFANRRVRLVRVSVSFGRTWTVTVWLVAVFQRTEYDVRSVGATVNEYAPPGAVISVAICCAEEPYGCARTSTASLGFPLETVPETMVCSP